MRFNISSLDEETLEQVAEHFSENGYVVLTGLGTTLRDLYLAEIARALEGLDVAFVERFVDGGRDETASLAVRQRLARVDTSPGLAARLLSDLEPIIARLAGPVVHVSSNYHAQLKFPTAREVDRGGYDTFADCMEVHAPYLLHQDFAGASFPTSPSALTLWTPLNTTPHWTLRLFPGSHRLGLLCDRWWRTDEPQLAALREPVDIQAEVGTAVVFHALLLHGTGNRGPSRRASCDIRFFPLCGFLPSRAHALANDPRAALRAYLARDADSVLAMPRLESLVFLGERVPVVEAPRASARNWVNYVALLSDGRPDEALVHLERFVNRDIGSDPLEVYAAKFHGKPFCAEALEEVRRRL